MECLTGESSPAATIEWRKNGKRVMDEGRESLPRLTTDGQPRGELTRSWFSLNASAQDDGSVITCLARNPLIEGSLARDDFALTVLCKFLLPPFSLSCVTDVANEKRSPKVLESRRV